MHNLSRSDKGSSASAARGASRLGNLDDAQLGTIKGARTYSGRNNAAFLTVLNERCNDCLPLQEAHHRIANHFSLLNSFVRLRTGDIARQDREPDRAQILLLLTVISVQIDTLARVHRLLAASGASAAIEIGDHIHECLMPFKSGLYGTVVFSEDFEAGCIAKPERILGISQIVAEVVTNAIKYGHAVKSEISVRCSKSAAGDVMVEVQDNGPGLPAGFDPLTSGGLGFRLLRALSRSLDARIQFESTAQGLHFTLAIPAKILAGET